MAVGDKIEVAPKKDGIAITGLGIPERMKISKEGTAVFTIDFEEPVGENEFEANVNLVTDVAFEKCGRVELAPVVQTLIGLLQGASHTVRLFDPEFL